MHYGGSTGMAVMRRDGFVSHHANAEGGELITRPIVFTGKHLFVNTDCPNGVLAAEITDMDGNVIPGFAISECNPVTTDSTITRISWKKHKDLSSLAGKPVKLRFSLKNGDLYSFWVSPSETGESMGYNAAGGPGFSGGIDREGIEAYKQAKKYMIKQ